MFDVNEHPFFFQLQTSNLKLQTSKLEHPISNFTMNDYFNIGKIVGSHGLAGEVVLEHALGKKSDLKGLQTLFVEDRKDSLLPYFVEAGKVKNETETYLKLEGVNTKETARRLNQKNVWLLKADFEKFVAKASAISMLDYKMINDGEHIGDVIEVIEQPMQVLCKIIYKGNEALIPIHQDTLKKIDQKKKEVHVSLPDGLLELYS
jgi:16S rRNA processing protein RimM